MCPSGRFPFVVWLRAPNPDLKGGDMRHPHRQINQSVQAAREQAIICYVYGKRG
jgi:hypothetical protein